jgi:tetratricopeptide (TPR) repeat protein/MinD-like ATPase involved in chromosome partitioning or flagellar assembly
MALVNTAQLFYEAGLKVLMIDWDLEAPGLERFFGVDIEEVLDKPGLMDMLLRYKQQMTQQSSESKDEDTFLPFEREDIKSYIIDVNPKVYAEGRLLLLPAGRRAKEHLSSYASAVLTFDWQDFYRNWEGELYFTWLRQQFEEIADVVLVDSRTGVTEMGGVCTYQLADVVVMFCTPNQQSLVGTYTMAQNFLRKEVEILRGGRAINVLVIPARIERAESELLDKFHEEFKELFKRCVPSLRGFDAEALWQLGIPYIPKYAFSDAIAVSDSHASSKDMATAFQRLKRVLDELRLTELVSKRPDKVAKELALVFSRVAHEDVAELVRLASLVETFAQPLATYPSLLAYVRGMAHYARGDVKDAITQIRNVIGLGDRLHVAGVSLPIPEQIRKELKTSFDVFVSYSHADHEWIRNWLVPRLREAGLRVCVDYEAFNVGVPTIVNIEQAVEQSRKTVLVLSPHWTESDWANFESLLVQTADPAERLRRMLPLMLEECTPLRGISVTKYVDFTDPARRGETLTNLVNALREEDNLVPAIDLPRLTVLSSVPFVLPQLGVPTFSGRGEELMKLEELLLKREGAKSGSIVGLVGIGGIGKSALACHFAELYRDNFPDGVIGLRVDGKDADAVSREFARYMGEEIAPEDERDAATIMHDVFGNRRALLIFDNADDAVVSSLRLGGTCAVIVTTSDRQLPSLLGTAEESRIDLAPLTRADALLLLERLLGRDRVASQQKAAEEIIKLVGGLPLALQTVGATLQMQEWRDLEDYAASLREMKDWLSKLQVHGASNLNVRASFSLSLKLLTDDEVDFFARLSVCAHDGFSVQAAMAAGDYDEVTAHERLGSLYRLSLLNLAETGTGRFVFHPLIRLFARELADERLLKDDAEERHARYYIRLVKTGNPEDGATTQLIAPELDNILLAAEWLRRHEEVDYEFVVRLEPFLEQQGYWQQAVELTSAFLTLAERNADYHTAVEFRLRLAKYLSLQSEWLHAEETVTPIADYINKIEPDIRPRLEARWLTTLGVVLSRQGRFREAADAFERSVEIEEKNGNSSSLAETLNNLGSVLQRMGRFNKALEVFKRNQVIYEELSNKRGVALVLNSTGGVLQRLGRFDEAVDAFRRSYDLLVELEDLRGQAMVLNSLGGGLQRLGQLDVAIDALRSSAALEEKLGNSRGLAIALNSLGGVLQRMGRFDEAVEAYQRSLSISERLDDQRNAAMVLNSLGGLLQRQGRFDEAVNVFRQSYVISERLNDQLSLAMVLNSLGGVLQRQGRFGEAEDSFLQSSAVLEQLGDQRGQAMVLNSLGGLLQRQGRFDEALECFQRSYEISSALGDQTSQAMVLNSLGGVLQRRGGFNEAVDAFQRSIEIGEKLGDMRHLAMAFTSLGGVLQRQGRFDEAVEACQRSLSISEQLGDRRSIAMALNNLAGVLQRLGRFDEALNALQRNVEIFKELGRKQDLATAYSRLGRALIRNGKEEEGVHKLTESFEIEESLKNGRSVASITSMLIDSFINRGQYSQALTYCQRALAISPNNKSLKALYTQVSTAQKEGGLLQLGYGLIKRIIKHTKGYRYGFISPSSGGLDVYFQERFVEPESTSKLEVGARVEFKAEYGLKGPRATWVKVQS